MILHCHCDPLVMIPNSFLHCDLYLSTGGVTRGQLRSNHVYTNSLQQIQDEALKRMPLYSADPAKSNDMQHDAVVIK